MLSRRHMAYRHRDPLAAFMGHIFGISFFAFDVAAELFK
jgi:hypothetical protein